MEFLFESEKEGKEVYHITNKDRNENCNKLESREGRDFYVHISYHKLQGIFYLSKILSVVFRFERIMHGLPYSNM